MRISNISDDTICLMGGSSFFQVSSRLKHLVSSIDSASCVEIETVLSIRKDRKQNNFVDTKCLLLDTTKCKVSFGDV